MVEKKKIYWLSDSPTTVTGYATISANVMNGLVDNGYDCYYQAHNIIGQNIMPGLTFEDGRKLNFTVMGTGRMPYSQDLLVPRIREMKPDVFITLLDSLTEERVIPILNKRNKVELLTFKELYDKYKNIQGIKTLSVRLDKNQRGNTLITEWKNINGIERRYVKDHKIINISQKYGNTRVTEKHSLICNIDNKLVETKPKDIDKNNTLLQVSRIPFKERCYSSTKLDLTEYIDIDIFDYDDKFIWLKNSKRKQEDKMKRFLDKNELKSLAKIFAWYISEGHCSNQDCIIISNTNTTELKDLSKDFIKIFKKQPVISNTKRENSDKTQSLTLWGKLQCEFLKNMAGHKSRNKFVPNFLYEVDEKTQLLFIDEIVKGDGHVHKPYTKEKNKFSNRGLRFSYTTLSLKLISGLSFMLKQLRIKFDIGYNPDNEDYNLNTVVENINKTKTFKKEEKYTGYIYDICVQDNENFIDCCGMIACHNTFMLYPWYQTMDFAPAKTVFYFPSDGGGFPLGCEQILRKCTVPVAMSKFGQKQLWDDHQIKCEYIPHAVDTKNYFPMTPEQKFQLKKKWGLEGKFVVGSVFRNQGRKMPDRQLRSFAEFAKGKDDVIFLLHTDPTDVAAVFNMTEFIKKLGIEHKVRFTGMTFHKGFTYKQMNDVYNLMDVHFLSTSGEGWGVPLTEAMACGIPGIVTDYTTTKEQLLDNGICGLAVPICTELMGNWNVDRGIMDIDKGTEALQMMYDTPKMREEMGRIGREKALKYYSWDVVNPMWDKLMEKLTNE